MKQRTAHKILQDIGGKATFKQLLSFSRHNYPCEHNYESILSSALTRMIKWGYVYYDATDRSYNILEPYPEPNIYHTTITTEDMIEE